MHSLRIAAAAACAALIATAAPAQQQSAPKSAPAEARPAKAKKVCRTIASDTGSRLGAGRKCRTREEWAEIDKTLPENNGSGVISTRSRP